MTAALTILARAMLEAIDADLRAELDDAEPEEINNLAAIGERELYRTIGQESEIPA